MSSALMQRTVTEFNLKMGIDTTYLTDDQIDALKKRLASAHVAVSVDSAARQIRLDAAKADTDNAISNAIKLEQTEAKYDVRCDSEGGSAKTNIQMSSRGDAKYGGCLWSAIVVLGVIGLIVFAVCGGKSKSRSSYRSNSSSKGYSHQSSTPYRSYGGYGR